MKYVYQITNLFTAYAICIFRRIMADQKDKDKMDPFVIVELTPAEKGDSARLIQTFDSEEDANMVLKVLESVNCDYTCYKVGKMSTFGYRYRDQRSEAPNFDNAIEHDLVMYEVMGRLSTGNMPKDIVENSKNVWEAFNAGRTYEKAKQKERTK